MSIVVQTYPKTTLFVTPSSVSKWSALHQPIVYGMIRQDKFINNITDNGAGKPKVILYEATAGMVAGQTVYINSGVYVGNYTILSVTSTTIIVLDATFISIANGGYCNLITLRPNYYVETVIYSINNSDTYYSVGESINKPMADGTFKVDVSSFLKSLVEYRDRFAYDVINRRDNTQGGRFNITYQEFWTGSATSPSGLSGTDVYYFVNAAKQIQQVYGSNMGEYVPFKNTNEPKGKFMGAFEKPTYFPGFPFSMSFIYSESLFGYELFKFERQKNINDGTVSTIDYELDNGQVLGVNRLMLLGDYPTTTKEVVIWLETGDPGCLQYVHNDYDQEEYTEEQCTPPVIEEPTGGPGGG